MGSAVRGRDLTLMQLEADNGGQGCGGILGGPALRRVGVRCVVTLPYYLYMLQGDYLSQRSLIGILAAIYFTLQRDTHSTCIPYKRYSSV